MRRTGRTGARPAAARPGRRRPAPVNATVIGRTVRDILRSYVNVRKPPGRAGAANAFRAASAAAISLPVEYDDSWADLSVGSINHRGILDVSADSLLGELILSVFEPTVQLDGDVTFSIVGLGRFMLEALPDQGSFRMVDLTGGYSVFSLSQGGLYSGQQAQRRPKKKLKVSITGFILSMLGELIRTPMFYVMLLAAILTGIYAWRKAKLADVG